MDKKKAWIYPYDITSMHMLEYAHRFTDYQVQKVSSPAGWGYSGEDAGKKIGVDTGLTVSDHSCLDFEDTDAVILLDSILKLDTGYWNNLIMKTADSGKEILDLRAKAGFEGAGPNYHSFGNSYTSMEDLTIKENHRLKNISKPIVLVLGSGERTNKFDIQLLARACFLEENFHVTQIGSKPFCEFYGFHSFPDFMYDPGITTEDKILKFNHYVDELARKEDGDVIIIGVPGGIAPHNDKYLNDFGFFNFMVANAIRPDYVILNTAYVDYNAEYMEALKTSLQYKYDYEVDSVFLSNQYINWETTEFIDELVYTTLDAGRVDAEALRCGVFSVYSEPDRSRFKCRMLKTLTGYSGYAAL